MAVAAVAIVAAVVSTVSAINQNRQAKKAAAAQEEASDIQGNQNKNQEAEARRQLVRKQRIQQAQIEQAASNTGVDMSSGEFGSLSALSTNSANNLAALSGQSAAARGIANANQASLNAQSSAQTWGTVGSVSNSIFSLTAGSLFAGKGTQPQTTAAQQTAAKINN
ncbi:hypothetical protein [Erwinia billingiae]|uniref:hypothetical protein n=1 Tax=Erwinia billingiae TaxID=182337 RepID=UPI00320B4C2F